MRLVLATQNEKKRREMQEILGAKGVEVVLQSELGLQVDVEETGSSFAENAKLKALAVCRATGLAALADDSGLCVDALDGAPGVYSARYGGAGLDDEGRWRLLLSNMEQQNARTARFRCAICCALPDGSLLEAEGSCEGEIARAPRGSGGFGYDPVFYLPEKEKCMAELSAEEKNEISHRGRALLRFAGEWEKHYGTNK